MNTTVGKFANMCVCMLSDGEGIWGQGEKEAETQAEGEAGSLQEPDVGLDPQPWDQALSQRQMLNH